MNDKKQAKTSDYATTRVFALLVCYDIADDDRRKDVADVLLGLGPRVQMSVFECRVRGGDAVKQLVGRLTELIDPLEDQIRIYNLGARLPAPTILGERTIDEWRDYIIV